MINWGKMTPDVCQPRDNHQMNAKTILIVDDDRTTVRLCQKLLERASYRVLSALDPLEALSILETQRMDLLISDIRMPIMDGFELITRAKQHQPDLPVLMMTGYGSIENAVQALHRGVDGLIIKPFENTTELVQIVQRVMEEAHQKREAARMQTLRPLFDVTEQLLAETSPEPLIRLILSAIKDVFQATFAGICLRNSETGELERIRAVDGQSSERPISDDKILSSTSSIDGVRLRSVLAAVEAGGRGLYHLSGSYEEAPEASEKLHPLLQEARWESLLVVPVWRNGRQILFCAARDQGNLPFSEAELDLLVILARQASVAMENARLYSDLREYIRRVEESQRALIQAEKMAAVGRLMATLAHEINNPLQSVHNCLHLASRPGIPKEQQSAYLAMTNQELNRLVETVRRMLDFYRLGEVEREKVYVQDEIGQVLALLTPQFREQNIGIHMHLAEKGQPVLAVKDQIRQVFFNVLMNAMDAIEEKASISPEAERSIWIDMYNEPSQARVRIEDSGQGIAPEMRGQVFEPFISTKKEGTGLGLAVSYGIMEEHNGRLTIVPPQYNHGACFEIVLPWANEVKYDENPDRR